jgi:transposase-like protein
MTKTTRARYTLEFQQEAVRLIDGGQSPASVANPLGLVEQTLFNWLKASRHGSSKAPQQSGERRADGDCQSACRTGPCEDGA